MNVPKLLGGELGSPKTTAGWSKSLGGLPAFSSQHINHYYHEVNRKHMGTSSVVKKHFTRGEQLLEEKFISLNSMLVKQDSSYFCVKGMCSASLRKKNRYVTIALWKSDASVAFAFCQCEEGSTGTCSHCFAMMKLLARWVLDKKNFIPEEKACTAKQCEWSVSQRTGKVVKNPIMDTPILRPNPNPNPRNFDFKLNTIYYASNIWEIFLHA